MPKSNGKMLRLIVATVLLIIGIAGIVLPVLHGLIFLAAAGILFSFEVPFVHKLICWIQRRYPKAGQWIIRTRLWMAKNGKEKPPCCTREEEKIMAKTVGK